MTSKSHIAVLLLKTKSTPGDSYEDKFATTTDRLDFEPYFVPVLEHRFEQDGIEEVGRLLRERRIGGREDCAYGGLIFTSQRAVEALSAIVDAGRGKGEPGWPHLQDVPVYSVGPATTRALKAAVEEPPLQVFGEHTGNGDNLAQFILQHYTDWYRERSTKPPLLFMVGQQRRDIIPKTLMDPGLPPHRRVQVDEVVVYGTGVKDSFPDDFTGRLRKTDACASRWVVVFSPTGCGSMLESLDMLDAATGKAKPKRADRNVFVATIGPTTRNFLVTKFGFEPDVCAEAPSPEGVWNGIIEFIGRRSRNSGYLTPSCISKYRF